ncbi:hypothetical protein M0812_19808 [Anaeramoeba flamelloides]|uniref:Uncharacterized protein n=1 Tax=Anaeramoeba flamelloides TaxID=1746091 RepID=A0AAV7Z055_9EUKA|nr:hypothetical protein M0812_19808 [Anaeramoeba flamelloides]
MSNEKKELNNNKFFRGISNTVDRVLGESYDDNKNSKTRAWLHSTYHKAMFVITKNPRERERAKDQKAKVFGGNTDNLKKYDEKHFPKKKENKKPQKK